MKFSTNRQFAVVGVALFLFGISNTSWTDPLTPDEMTPPEIYARCYAKLLRKPIPLEDSTLTALNAGTLTDAENACDQLLDRASLSPTTGTISKIDDIEASDILSTLQMLHNSWFIAKAPPSEIDGVNENKLLFDMDEPGLYWSRALLTEGLRADSVLTANKGLKTLRYRENSTGKASLTHFQARPFMSYKQNPHKPIKGVDDLDPELTLQYMSDLKKNRQDGNNYEALKVPNEHLVQFGRLIGIEQQTPMKVPRLILPQIRVNMGVTKAPTCKESPEVPDCDVKITGALNGLKGGVNGKLQDPKSGPNLNVDLHNHFGGGILGSVVYGLKNSAMGNAQLANSYTKIDRRFAARMFQDLLCYELPILDASDVTPIESSEYPFQQTHTCMQCHATIDELAMTFKNNVWVSSSETPAAISRNKSGIPGAKESKGGRAMTHFKLPPAPGSLAFALQEPLGELHFRTFSNNKVRVPVKSLGEVGENFAKLDDFYLCAAKRYYRYFVGVDVKLRSSSAKSLNTTELEHLEAVQNMGKALKENQSLKSVLHSIFRSKAFQSRNYRTTGGSH